MLEDLKKKIVSAQSLHQDGKLDHARLAYKKILKFYPDTFDVRYLLGTLELQTNNFQSGSYHLLKAIKLNPKFPSSYNNLAIAYTEMSFFEDALVFLDKAISIKYDYYEAFNNRGNIFLKLKKYDEALINYKKTLEINPEYSQAFNNMGNVYSELKQFKKAKNCFNSAILINPQYLVALNNLGNCYKDLEQYEEAILTYEKAIKVNQSFSESYINLAKVLTIINRFDTAKDYYNKALNINSVNSTYYSDFGIYYIKLEKFDEGIDCFKKAIALNQNSYENYKNLAICYLNKNSFSNAILNFKKAITINSKSPELFNYLAHTLSKLNNLSEANLNFKKALELDTNFIGAYINLGNMLKGSNKLSEAIFNYEKALKLDRKKDFLIGDLLNTYMMTCNWKFLKLNIQNIRRSIQKKNRVITPFASLSIFNEPKLIKLVAEIFSDYKCINKNKNYKYPIQNKNQKIRIGYFSSDFNQNHPVSHLLYELFQYHNKNDFEIYGFSLQPAQENDTYRKKFKKDFDFFYDFENYSDNDVVEFCRSLNLDIAVDLNGHMQNARTMIFSCRVAPLQINYLGFVGSMGANYYDYIIADKFVIPLKYKKYYSEKIAYMPDSYLINPSYRNVSKFKNSKDDFGIPDNKFIFCSFSNSYKILPDTLQLWINILNDVDGSILWLAETNKTAKENILNYFFVQGINPNRIVFANRKKYIEDHLARYNFVDLFLDTFPYNAHTTACDALYLGVPVLTMYGDTFTSRVGLSLLKNLDVEELITSNTKEYQDKAIFLAKNPEILNGIKQKIIDNVKVKPLFNSKLSTRNLEKIYIKMHSKFYKGEKLESFDINN